MDGDVARLKAQNGPVYVVTDHTLTLLQRVSAVEWMKWSITRFADQESIDRKRELANWGIDLFILFKWSLVLCAWYFGWINWVLVTIIAYLLLMNIHTYFWYHLWIVERNSASNDSHRERRRFVNLVSATAFSVTSYAYLYHRVVPTHFEWPPSKVAQWASALTFSIGNAFWGVTGDLKPATTGGYLLVSSQLVMTFLFVVVLISNSIPSVKNDSERIK